MIAQPDQHVDIETLRKLLDEDLSGDIARVVERHLSGCAECRRELEKIAGQPAWWDETIEVLSQSTVTREDECSAASTATTTLDPSVDWIRPLLGDPIESLEEPSASVSGASVPSGLGRIDHYVVQGVIGQGGMGVVLRALDRELNRPVAIKVLSPHLAGVGAARARFMREAQAAAAIVHPSIVPIYSVVPSARLPYIVMPCISGGNLQQRINRDGPLEIDEVLRIGVQVAEGLAAAHKHGVIHRDIKPANILVEEGNGRVLISDFGLARALDDATLTNSGMIAGTPQYMSPEQARGEPIDARSDLYSLGSLLYTLSTGRVPFRAESPLAVLRKISDSRPRPVHQVNERVPPWFDTLVSRLMQTDVTRRSPDAETVAGLLREAHAHVRNPSVHRLPRSLTRPRFHIALLAVVAVAAGVMTTLASQTLLRNTAEGDATARLAVAHPRQPETPAESAEEEPPNAVLTWYGESLSAELAELQLRLMELARELESTPLESRPITVTPFTDEGEKFDVSTH